MEIANASKVAGARKRGAPLAAQTLSYHSYDSLKLERAYGSGSCAAAPIACPHPVVPGLLAYSCGAVVVLYDSQYKQQTSFFSPKPRRTLVSGKPFVSLAFSRDGAYLAAGERSAQGPEILIWEVSANRCLQALKGHKHGVGSLAFSQDGRLLVSTGESYDGQLCVWDWQAGTLLARQHTQAEVQRACFAEELAVGAGGLTITTVGKAGHFKVWSLALPSGRSREGQLSAVGQASLTARPASLKEYRNSNFVSVAPVPSDGSTLQTQALMYALTQNGMLLTLRPAIRTIDKSLSLQVPAAFALAVSSNLIACACTAGVVRLFATRTLAFKGNLPRPSTGRSTGGGTQADAGRADGGSSGGGGMVSALGGTGPDPRTSAGALFPDAVGCAFHSTGDHLTVVYADRSLMIWDVRNPARITRVRSVLSHAGVVWSAALIPSWQAALMGPLPQQLPGGGSAVTSQAYGAKGVLSLCPSPVLCTCGADGTVRLWNICLNNSTVDAPGVSADMAASSRVTRTLRATIHAANPVGPDANGTGGAIAATAAAAVASNRRYAPDAPLPVPGASGGGGGPAGTGTKPAALRCLRVSPCGRHLAAGDARGNLRVFSLVTLQLVMLREAHDAEILSLDYSAPSLDGVCYLASSSRDMLVHVYDVSRGYELVGTCDAHSGAVTAVRFSAHGGRLALLSCSADKSVVFRLVQLGFCGLSFEIYHTERMSRGVLYDMAVDPAGDRAVAVCQDNQLRLFDVATGGALRSFSGDPSCGEAVAVTLDTSGQLAICSCADGSVAVYDVDAGALLARGLGHSDVCTGAVLLEGHRGLMTVGGDGCALLWRLTPRMTQRMQEASVEAQRQLEQQAEAQAAMVQQQQRQQEVQPQDGPQRRQQQQQQREEDVTPAVRRRKAWALVAAVEGGGAAAERGHCGVDVLSRDDGGALVEDEEPQQVHVDMSATIMRILEGKPLLSLEKLPKWAQRTFTGYEAATPAGAHIDSTSCASAAMTGASISNEAGGTGTAPILAGVWAQRAAQVPPLEEEAAMVSFSADVGRGPPEASKLPAPCAEAAGTASVEAHVCAATLQPRTWADAVEEDDEIVFYDSLDGEDAALMLLRDSQEMAVEIEPSDAVAAAAAGTEVAIRSAVATGLAGPAPPVANRGGDVEHGDTTAGSSGLGDGGLEHCTTSPCSPPTEAQPASGCASNCPGGALREDSSAVDGDAVKPRDLFREHFDSLGLDAGSATKAPSPNPRRLSFTHMYRQVRASSGAGGQPDAAATPIRAAAASDSIYAVQATGTSAGGLPTTPYVSRLPLPPAVNSIRGVGDGGVGVGGSIVLPPLDGEGAATSAAWTPEAAMLPLMSPALAKTDKQLQELERIRLRLLSTLRKRQTNEEAAVDAPASAATLAASPLRLPEPATGRTDAANAPAAAAPGAAVCTEEPIHIHGATRLPTQHQPPPQQAQAAVIAASAAASEAVAGFNGDAAASAQDAPEDVREEVRSAGGFLLPPPPAYTSIEVGVGAEVGGQLQPEAPSPQPSQGFSSLSNGTPMLGHGGDEGGGGNTASPIRGGGHGGEEASSRVFVFNPIYGASPSTTIIGGGSAAAAVLQRVLSGHSQRGGGGDGGSSADAGPACCPADSDAVESTPDDVIRAILKSSAGAASDGYDSAVADGGVCVVTNEGLYNGDGKEQQRQVLPEVRALEAGSARKSPSKELQQQRQRLALPSIRPWTCNKSAKSLAAVSATSSLAAYGNAPPECPQEADASAEAALARMQLATHDFVAAYHRLFPAPTQRASAPAFPMDTASRYQAAARIAVEELSEVLAAQETTQINGATLCHESQQQGRELGQMTQGPPADVAAGDVPPAVFCRSPHMSADMSGVRRGLHGLSRIGRGFRGGVDQTASVSVSATSGSVSGSVGVEGAASGGNPAVSGSQVILEMGLVESMVEEKLKQRMQEEMRRVEETVVQRIMQTIQQQQQQQ